jgi:hypothetical protein
MAAAGTDCDEILKRIGNNSTLKGYVIVNAEGTIIRTDMESQQATKVSQDLRELSELSKSGVRYVSARCLFALLRTATAAGCTTRAAQLTV